MSKDPIKILTPVLSYPLANGGTVKVSSEFVEHVEATEPFSAIHRLAVVQRSTGEIMAISIGTDDKLYLLYDHLAHDITLKDKRVVTFDAYQSSPGGKVTIVIATQSTGSQSDTSTEVYLTTFDVNKPPSAFEWTVRPSKQTPAKVTTLYLSAEDCIAGVQGAAGEYSSTFSIPLSGSAGWTLNPIPEDSDKILQVISGFVNGRGNGIFVLYHLKNDDQGIAFLQKDSNTSSTYSIPDRTSYDMASVTRESAFSSDLYVATNKGLAYFAPGKAEPEFLLSSVDCRQVVAHSTGNTTSILVVSSSDDLYFIRRHESDGGKYEFISSGLSIRPGVKVLGVQSNVKADAADVVLLSANGTLVHFWKDLDTSLWSERPISFTAPFKSQKYPAYVSTCTIADAEGVLKGGAKVNVSSLQTIYVTINDVQACLTKEPKPFFLDESARLAIVMRTPENLGSVKFKINYDGNNIDVDAAQRVITKLSFVKDVTHLEEAKSLKGDLIFKNAKKDDLQAGAESLSSFSSAVQTLDPKMTTEFGLPKDPVAASSQDAIFFSGNWWDDVKEVWHDVGDGLQHLGQYIKKGLQMVIKGAVGVVNIFAKVLGKVVKIVVKAVGEVLRFVATALHDIFGLDTSGFLHWVGFIFDWDKYKVTAKHLTDGFEAGCALVKHTFDGSGPDVDAFFEDIRKNLKNVIGDFRASEETGLEASTEANKSSDESESSFGWISDNSVVQSVTKYLPGTNVLKIIKKALEDEIDIPGAEKFADIFKNDIADALSKELDNVTRLAKDVFNKLKDLLGSQKNVGDVAKEILNDLFWTIFDAVKIAVVATMNVIGKIVDAGSTFINGRMKLPFFTALWEELTETDFTVANIVAIPVSVMLNIYTITRYDKLPFDLWTPPKLCLPNPSTVTFPKWSLSKDNSALVSGMKPNEDSFRHAKIVSLWLSNLRCWTGFALTVVEVLQSVGGDAEAASEPEKISLKDIASGNINKGNLKQTAMDLGDIPSKKDIKSNFIQNLRRGIFAVYTVLQAGGVAVLIYEKANDPSFIKNPTAASIAPFAGSVIGLFLSSLGFCIDEKLEERKSKIRGFSILRPISTLLTEPIVIGFEYADATKKAGGAGDLDNIRLTSGVLEVSNAACDIAAIACSKVKNAEAAIIPLGVSLPINIASSALAIGASFR